MPAFELPPPSRDPLYAPLTPPGSGAIASYLLDGEGAFSRFRTSFRSKVPLSLNQPGQLVLGHLIYKGGQIADEIVAAPKRPDESPTRFEQVELSSHGGEGAAQSVRDALEAAGFRAALPGELQCRAHRAGQLSLIQLEAQLRLPNRTARQTEFLLKSVEFQLAWERIGMEAAYALRQRQPGWNASLLSHVQKAAAGFKCSNALLQTHGLVLLGAVNAGKSTLTNRLLRAEKSVVSPEPGTTRDLLERPCELRGLSFIVADSAGLRDLGPDLKAQSSIEAAGQQRALNAAHAADVILYLLDASCAPSEEISAQLEKLMDGPHKERVVLVFNKADQGIHAEAHGLAFSLGLTPLTVSALTGDGLEALESALETRLLGTEPFSVEHLPFTQRQWALLQEIPNGPQEGLDATQGIGHIRSLIGTRPNEVELEKVFREFFAEVPE